MKQLAVLLASFNGERYIAQQIESLLCQTFQEFTLYVHDDGSEDETCAVLQDYAKRYPDRICLLEYPPVHSPKDNFFSLLQRTEAEYYMFCDQDDVWLPEKIQLSMEQMMEIEGDEKEIPCAVFSDMTVTDASLQVLHASYLQYRKKNPKDLTLSAMLVENPAAGCTMICNRTLAKLAVSYRDSRNLFMHDWWMILIASVVGRIAWIDKPLLLYRQHGNNTVGAGSGTRSWLKRIIQNVLSGRQLDASREGILYQRNMAAELNRILNMLETGSESEQLCSAEDRKLLQKLSEIGSESKWKRICFYRENHLLKQDGKNFWKLLLV